MKVDVDDVFAALSDPTRRGVVDRLRRRPHAAGELARAFDMTAPAMSKHLRVLRLHGLVEEERSPDDARVRIFRLRQAPFRALHSWVTRVEAYWADQLDAFQAHVARAAKSRKKSGRGKR